MTARLLRTRLALATLLLYGLSAVRADETASRPLYGQPRRLATLPDVIHESSGLAVSHERRGWLWTHNDSGDSPRLFLLDDHGKLQAEWRLREAESRDWEDLCSFQLESQSWLLVGDIGDNGRRRPHVTLYLVREPDLAGDAWDVRPPLPVVRRTHVVFEAGPCDCEALAVDPVHRQILLVGKRLGTADVYALPLEVEPGVAEMRARKLAQLELPPATGMDISPDGRRAVIATYLDAYEYVRGAEEDWRQAFQKAPRRLTAPARRQGEAICYGNDGVTLYLTSEGYEAPLWKVSPRSVP